MKNIEAVTPHCHKAAQSFITTRLGLNEQVIWSTVSDMRC